MDAKITSSYYIATDYIANELQKSAVVANASLTYETSDGRWSLTGYVRNIGDIAVATGGFEHPFMPGLVFGTIGAPRTYGAILQGKILIAQPMCAGWSAHIGDQFRKLNDIALDLAKSD